MIISKDMLKWIEVAGEFMPNSYLETRQEFIVMVLEETTYGGLFVVFDLKGKFVTVEYIGKVEK